MRKLTVCLLFMAGILTFADAQVMSAKFGKGLQVMGKDSSFYLRAAFRFQNLSVQDWTIRDGSFEDYESSFLIRRSRLKFDGWAVSPKLKYKFELGLSNRDISGGISPEFRTAPKFILDAYIVWNFFQNFAIQFGQAKLPGNRERVISSANLQLVDRSRLNSRYNIDRDVGVMLKHHFKIGQNFIVKEVVSLSQGEGRNITEGHFGGHDFTFRVELLPFGKFQSKGDYVGSAIKKEEKPKLAIGLTYDTNQKAARERGQNGSFITDSEGNYHGKDLNTFFADLMFKYQNFSLMAEYADKKTSDDSPFVVVDDEVIGTYFTGNGLNVQAGYMLPKNWELVFRYTDINPQEGVSSDEDQYTFGLSKFVVGHKLKVQTDFTLVQKEMSDDTFMWRTQLDIHF